MVALEFNINILEPDNRHNPSFNIFSLKKLKFLSQNLNSFNVSTKNHSVSKLDKYNAKLCHILKSSNDIILLQDTRLGCNKNLLELTNDILCTKYGNYTPFFNSTMSKRGVGILIKKEVDFKVLRTFSSVCENVLILDITINNFRLSLLSVYGPPESSNRDFFAQVKNKIIDIGNDYFILGGDLNAIATLTPPSLTPELGNLDAYCMAALPNPLHCIELYNWVSSGFAVDIYRLLNPDKVDFSYTPFPKSKNNRSRIDAFIISNNFVNVFSNCDYIENRISLFDHKGVQLKSKNDCNNSEKKIDKKLLDLEGLKEVVKFEIYELILDHCELENILFLKQTLNQINTLNIEKKNLINSIYKNDLLVLKWINDKTESIDSLCQHFPTIDYCYNQPCRVAPDLFLDLIFNTLKNSIISFQSNYIRAKNIDKNILKQKLYSLKKLDKWSNSNMSQIDQIERELVKIADEENLRLLNDFKYFDIMQREKGGKHFSKILRNANTNSSMSQIKNINGDNFPNSKAREKFIFNHFKRKFDTPLTPNKSLNEFLGGLVNDPLYRNQILTNEDREALEGEITLLELEKSLNSSNFNSSCGIDGIPMSVLHKFWDLIKVPIRNGFNYMIRKKELSSLMRCTRLRLIPKSKTLDLSDIGAFRPIASLTSPYKLFSGVFASRLESVINKIVYKCQKAYSSKFAIQEGLITCYELINKAIKTKTELGILNLDFQSAFDSVSHDYLRDVFQSLNCGPFFLDFLNTILNNRYGHILTDEGFTENFLFRIGLFQGDRASGNLFKVCLNPLLIKIISSNNIRIPREIPFNIRDVNYIVDPVTAFADDGDIFFQPTINNLDACNQILISFGEMTGLRINRSKTKICLINNIQNNDFMIHANMLGFTVVEEFKMLGIIFDYKLQNMQYNWNKVINKMNKIKNFWGIFSLTTPGKVAIIKTFLLPQITYLSSILSPDNQTINNIENIIVSFLNQNNKIARSKIFNCVKNGGLGVPNIRLFLRSLDVLLFKKTFLINDTWCKEIHFCSVTSEEKFYYDKNLNPVFNPILHRILESYKMFANSYWIEHSNIQDIRIFHNDLFSNSQGNIVSRNVFTDTTWNRYSEKIKGLKFSNFLNDSNKPLNQNSFHTKNNIIINVMEFFRLISFIRFNLDKYKNKLGNPHRSIDNFFTKKGLKSKHYRRFFLTNSCEISNVKTTLNRYTWAEINVVDNIREIRFHKVWTYNFLPIEVRDFSFKILNNYHKFNASIAHFNENISACCTLCTLDKLLPAPKETIKHFYYDCPVSENFAKSYFETFLANVNIDFSIDCLLLGAHSTVPESLAFIFNIEIIFLNFFLLNARNKKHLPLMRNFNHFMCWYRTLLLKNKKYAVIFQKFIFDPG